MASDEPIRFTLPGHARCRDERGQGTLAEEERDAGRDVHVGAPALDESYVESTVSCILIIL